MKYIAEISANHNGSLTRALDTIDAAAKSGATHVKFQTFTPEQMAVPHKLTQGPWKGRELIDLYRQAHTPREWHPELFAKAYDVGLIPFSSPFHKDDVDFLETLDCPIYKIASFELIDMGLGKYIANTGKPVIASIGQVTKHEIRYIITNLSVLDLTLMYCVSEYPCDVKNANLSTIEHLRDYFRADIGLSDHSKGDIVACTAMAMGITAIEKHFTLSKEGLDADFSMTPLEFKQMVDNCKDIALIKGDAIFKGRSNNELRRSLYYNQDLEKGTIINRSHLKTARPNNGLSPLQINDIIGTTLNETVKLNEPVKLQ